jgi:hypothetical protein
MYLSFLVIWESNCIGFKRVAVLWVCVSMACFGLLGDLRSVGDCYERVGSYGLLSRCWSRTPEGVKIDGGTCSHFFWSFRPLLSTSVERSLGRAKVLVDSRL